MRTKLGPGRCVIEAPFPASSGLGKRFGTSEPTAFAIRFTEPGECSKRVTNLTENTLRGIVMT